MFQSDLFLLLSLLLSDFLSFFLFFSLDSLLFVSLKPGDMLVELGEQMRELGVNFVDEVCEISACFVVNTFEKENRSEILFKILELVPRQLWLQNRQNVLFLTAFNLFGQVDHTIFDGHDTLDIFLDLTKPNWIHINDLSTNELYLDIRSSCDLINKIPDSKFCTLTQNILNMSAFDKIHTIYRRDNTFLILSGFETRRIVSSSLLEQKNSFFEHKVVNEKSFLFCE